MKLCKVGGIQGFVTEDPVCEDGGWHPGFHNKNLVYEEVGKETLSPNTLA
jgi:hypothetical protein